MVCECVCVCTCIVWACVWARLCGRVRGSGRDEGLAALPAASPPISVGVAWVRGGRGDSWRGDIRIVALVEFSWVGSSVARTQKARRRLGCGG